jgi:hypothetical protein
VPSSARRSCRRPMRLRCASAVQDRRPAFTYPERLHSVNRQRLHSDRPPAVRRQDVRAVPPYADLACMRGLPVDACVRPLQACPRRPGRIRSGR